MNRSEINEIKKNIIGDRLSFDRLSGCYVDHEKRKKALFHKSFAELPEDETWKYFDIFRRTLSGSAGKNLLTLEFPIKEEETGGAQEFLLTLRDTSLKEEELVEELFDRIIEYYSDPENFYIVLAHGVYDIPGITKDRIENDDASDNVYDFVICSICPVKLSKAGLSFDESKKTISQRKRDWVVDQPVKGFLFPAFQDRTGDIHSALYFTKKPADVQPELFDALFATTAPLSAPEQKETFQAIIEETIGEDGDMRVVKNIHELLSEMMIGSADDPEPLEIGKKEIRQILEDAGVSKDGMERFDTAFENAVDEGDGIFTVANVSDIKKMSIESPDVVIRVKPDRADRVMPRVVEGKDCLLIEVDDHVEVNGINVRTIFRK